jgi:hypothetical protein
MLYPLGSVSTPVLHGPQKTDCDLVDFLATNFQWTRPRSPKPLGVPFPDPVKISEKTHAQHADRARIRPLLDWEDYRGCRKSDVRNRGPKAGLMTQHV